MGWTCMIGSVVYRFVLKMLEENVAHHHWLSVVVVLKVFIRSIQILINIHEDVV